MVFQCTARYEHAVEACRQGFYPTLSAKDRRRYAAVEARQRSRGGVSYVAEVLGCSTRPREHAASELDQLPNDRAAGCDCGGSNSANQYRFKHDLPGRVADLGIAMRVAHDPSYCSQYNPIERRFCPQVGRTCQGVLFDTLDTVVRLRRNATTRTSLKTTVNMIRRVYETGRQVAEDFKASMPILFDDLLPQWNYHAVPQCSRQ